MIFVNVPARYLGVKLWRVFIDNALIAIAMVVEVIEDGGILIGRDLALSTISIVIIVVSGGGCGSSRSVASSTVGISTENCGPKRQQ